MSPTLGEALPYGETRCAWSLYPGAPQCEKPGTLHWLTRHLVAGHNATLVTCEQHGRSAAKLAIDMHALDANCNMPGTTWIPSSSPTELGACRWDESTDDTAALAEEHATA